VAYLDEERWGTDTVWRDRYVTRMLSNTPTLSTFMSTPTILAGESAVHAHASHTLQGQWAGATKQRRWRELSGHFC
jgi:hypothetical protein